MQPKAAFSASRETLLLARNLRESRLALRPHNQGRFCGARFASDSPRIGLCSAPASQDSPRAAITAARVACLLGEVFPARAADFGCKMPLRSDDGNPSQKETTGRQPNRRSVPSPPDSPLPNGRPGKRACSNKHSPAETPLTCGRSARLDTPRHAQQVAPVVHFPARGRGGGSFPQAYDSVGSAGRSGHVSPSGTGDRAKASCKHTTRSTHMAATEGYPGAREQSIGRFEDCSKRSEPRRSGLGYAGEARA